MAKRRAGILTAFMLASIGGGAAAIASTALLTLLMSFAVCLGVHPEAAAAAEWAAPVLGLFWAGAIVRRYGPAGSVGAGAVVGLAWALTWLYLMGRFDARLWVIEALPSISLVHILAWVSAPVLSALGGLLGMRLEKKAKYNPVTLHIAVPVLMLLIMLAYIPFLDSPGKHPLADGVSMVVDSPDSEGTTSRLLTFDFAANPQLQMGIYDRDSDDPRPYDDINTSYFATPALSVFEKLGPDALCVANAGFFMWTQKDRIASHVAPVVTDGRARYNVFTGPELWTFGWKMVDGAPEFRLLRDVPFSQLEDRFDWALGHARPLVVDGKPLDLKPGAGVTKLRCSRMSLGWSSGSKKLYMLVIREPDAEKASIAKMEAGQKQEGGWDLPRVQRYWMRMGVHQALALDGGDSTQLVYTGPHGTTNISSGRMSHTLGYLRNRPLRIWIPILPTRQSNAGVINYLYVKNKR